MKKKLQLQKETLVRLREQQLSATQGGNGAALAESRGVDSANDFNASFASCCRKTCNGPKEEEEIGIE
jgi:hypothetical protein